MDEVNDYHCNCAPGYSGENCSTGEYANSVDGIFALS